jgi:hypothetical protein
MKIKPISYICFRYIVLILLFITSVTSGVAQLTTTDDSGKKQDKSTVEDKTSLQGLTEAILIDGQPALRIISGRAGSTEIRLQQRDNEEALVFSVTRVVRFGFGYKPGDEGKLIVTKTRVIYSPYFDNKQFLSVLSSDIKDLTISVAGASGILALSFEVKNDKKRFISSGVQLTKKDLRPSLGFLFRVIKNFDSGLAEFNQLTASVRSKSEDDEEEAEKEETEADVNDKYDRFKDLTIVTTSKMLVRGSKRSIRTYAEYNFAGKNQKKPEKVSLYFFASATRPLFREDDLKLNFLVDDKRLPLGELRLEDEEKTKTTTKQTIVVTMPYETFAQIANSKKAEFQIGKLEYKLTDIHLEAFRKLLTYKIEE